MDPVIKQRLVGSLVLLALAVVFWPIVFVEPETLQTIELEPLPPQPTFDETPLPRPEIPEAAVVEVPESPVSETDQAAADATTRVASQDEPGQSAAAALETMRTADELDPPLTRTAAPEPVVLDDGGYPESWVLQVATVSSAERAKTLVGGLQKRGYEAFSREVTIEQTTLWRVQIGPKLERRKLETIKIEVDPALKVNSAILRYAQ